MYLSKIYIKNFRGIKELLVKFDKKLNVIIGANGQLKNFFDGCHQVVLYVGRNRTET